jgi:hypothetical protein
MCNHHAIEARADVEQAFVERSEAWVTHFVPANDLADNKLRIKPKLNLSRARTECGLQGGNRAAVFGLIVCAVPDGEAGHVEFLSVDVKKGNTVRGRTRIAARSAVCVRNDLVGQC